MYKLLVSYDTGCNYSQNGESEDLDSLVKRGEEYDKEMLRWIVEDEKGNIVAASLIHRQIIAFMNKVNS